MAVFGDNNLLCLDWDDRSLRAVEVAAGRSHVRVRHAVHVPIAAGVNSREPVAMGEFIRKALAEHRIRTRRVIVDLPRESVILHRMSLPPGTTDELAAMVHIQIAKELPFNKDSAIIDFAVSKQEGAETADVWVAAARNNIIDHYQQVIEAARLKLERIGLRPYANLAALTAGDKMEGRVLFVDIGPSMTEIDIVRDGQVTYSRSAAVSIPTEGLEAPSGAQPDISPGGEDDDDATIPLADLAPELTPTDNLLVEVSRTIEAYRISDPGARIDRVVLAGTGGVTTSLARAFERRFNVTAQLYEPAESLKWRGQGSDGVVFSAAFGLALSSVTEPARRFDFLHPKEPDAGKKERTKKRPRLVAAVVMLVASGIGLAYYPFQVRNDKLEDVQTTISDVQGGNKKTKQKARRDQLSKSKDLAKWLKQDLSMLDYLSYVSEALPDNKDAYLRELRYDVGDKGGYFKIVMDMREPSAAYELVERLDKLDGSEGETVFYDSVVGNRMTDNSSTPKYPKTGDVTIPVKALRLSGK